VPSEFEPVDQFELRKRRDGTETEEDTERRSLYQVLPEQQIRAKGFFGGERAYDVSKNQNLPVLGQEDRKRKKPGDIDVALDPTQLEDDGLTSETVRRRYEAAQEEERRQRQGHQFQEDLSDMIAQESRKRQKREEENAKRKKEKYRF